MSDQSRGIPPACVDTADLPAAIAHALAIVGRDIAATNEILANLEAQAATRREYPRWQRHWLRNLQDLTSLNELVQLFDIPIVRLIARERARLQSRSHRDPIALAQALRN